MGPLGPLLHVEKYVVVLVGGWVVVVCKAILVITLGLLVQADQKYIKENIFLNPTPPSPPPTLTIPHLKVDPRIFQQNFLL